MPSESSRAQLEKMDKAEFIELLRFCLPASKSSKSRFTNKAHSPGGLMTNWQSIARTAGPQVMVCEYPSPEVYDKTGTKPGWTKGTSRAHAFYERASCFVNQYGKSRTGKRTPGKTRDYHRRAICLKAFAGNFWIVGPRSSLEMQHRSDSQYEGRKSNPISLRQSHPASKYLLRFLQLTTESPADSR